MHSYATGSRGQLFAYIAIASVVIALILDRSLASVDFAYGWLVSAPSVGAAYTIIVGLVDKFFWKHRWLRSSGVVHTPIVDGIYAGTITSTYGDNHETKVKLEVNQSWLKILLRLELTDQESSVSHSVAAALDGLGHSDARLIYTYVNRIRPGRADADMADHSGTAEITFYASGTASGTYYNSRGRQGTIQLDRVL